VNPVSVPSPAKLNLYLSVTGRRPDGFHDLVSLVAKLAWGDRLTVVDDGAPGFRLECDAPGVPLDKSNLVVRAAEAFRAATGGPGGARFILEKRIPMGAGLGGGSSNAAAALEALNALTGRPLSREDLLRIAAGLGSDCPLFLIEGPAVLRGRGDRVEAPAAPALSGRLRGRRVLVFKPGFGVPTPGAYAALARAGAYDGAADAEAGLAAWMTGGDPLHNSFEPVIFAKHLALPAALGHLRGLGLSPMMTGSGSACFAFLGDRDAGPATRFLREAWGRSASVVETTLA
jgi:4-diphosphocytidyl-2-C-methyl-D-erythritol kinase